MAQPADRETLKKAILMRCPGQFIDDLRDFLDEADSDFLRSFWSLSVKDRKQLLEEVLQKFHPDLLPNEPGELADRILDGIRFEFSATQCSSCNLTYSKGCKSCGNAYCQLCLMRLASTSRRGKCSCGAALSPWGTNF